MLAGVVLVTLFTVLSLYPGHDPRPNRLPIAVVGQDQPGGIVDRLAHNDAVGSFDLRQAASRDDALEMIKKRDVYGALVIEGKRETLLVTSAASKSVSDLLTKLVADRPEISVEDVVPTAKNDPRGTVVGLTTLAILVPAVLGSMLLIGQAPLLSSTWRVITHAVFAISAGLAGALVIHTGIEGIGGNFFAVAGIAALAVLAGSLLAAGLIELIGPIGSMLAFLVLLMVGSPASGATTAPDMLPEPWQTVGQFMPPGAFGTGLRNAAYFGGRGWLQWGGVLVAWSAVGAALIYFAAHRQRTAEATQRPTPA